MEPVLIVEAKIEMDSLGKYTLTVVDYLNNTTTVEEVPDQYIGYIPLLMQQLQARLGK